MFDSAKTGSQIGPYKIVRRLGGGDTADVLLATRAFPGDFERRVVIKRLRAFDDGEHDASLLVNEAQAYARVAHPAIVQLFDLFTQEGEVALVLEYVDGVSLAKLVAGLRQRRDALGDRAAYYVVSRVFAALAAAHAARDPATGRATPVIHRDVSPDNVLIPWDGFAKLGDFDLAKVVGVSSDTRSGLLKGTYGYMAPEQIAGEQVTPRTDVYAACLVLRELLLDRPAFDPSLPELEILRAMDEAKHAPIESLRGGITPRLADAMSRGLARDPAQRTLAAAEMVDVLRSQTDMEAAHAELIATLWRVRGRDGRAPQSQPTRDEVTERRSEHVTPRGLSRDVVRESLAPLGETMRPKAREWRGQVAGVMAIAAGVGALAAMYVVAVVRATNGADDAADVSLATAPYATVDATRDATRAPAAPFAAVDAAIAPPGPAPALAMGDIRTPASLHEHRVFVDGEVKAWHSGESIRVPCGGHVVRIGSRGASQRVEVPCGGIIDVEPPAP